MRNVVSLLLWLALVLPVLTQMPPVPPGPRVNGVLTTRVDPADPTVTLDWDVGDIAEVTGIDWEILDRPFSDVHPITLTDEPLRQGSFEGKSGHGPIDLKGLPDGTFYIRYIGKKGKREVTLASEAARFVIIAGHRAGPSTGGPGPSGRPTGGPVSPAGPGPGATGPPLRLVPDSINLPVNSVQKFWLPPELKGVTALSWEVDGGPGEVDPTGVYRAPAVVPGGGLTAPVKLVARLSDGRTATADIMLLCPVRFLGVEPSGSIKAGKTLQFRGMAEGITTSVPTWTLVSGPGQLKENGVYTAPRQVDSPQRLRVRINWPGVCKPTEVELTVIPGDK
ncbi:hypothetical protein DYH09_30680 [bacterium CPR1]|nr:hypothetical protein [bacterium CPR1]